MGKLKIIQYLKSFGFVCNHRCNLQGNAHLSTRFRMGVQNVQNYENTTINQKFQFYY